MLRRYVLAAIGFSAMAMALPGQAEAGEDGAVATFAGGCFWCVEEFFDEVDGVLSTTSGYTGGHVEDPTYRQVVSGQTGHAEAVRVVYDPDVVSYEGLLEAFWRNVDPLDGGGQFCDRGSPYRTGIFVHDDAQRHLAEESREEVAERLGQPVVTEITDAGAFYVAEDYHQGYYQTNPVQYLFYKTACGREARLDDLWGEEPDS